MKGLKLTEFAKQRGIERDTVTQYIRRNPEMFEGHTKLEGKWLFIDEVAEKALDEKYPLPRPIEIVEDIETIKELSATRMELAKSQEMIVQLQNRLMEAQEQIATSKATELLLEDKKQQITELKNTIAKKDDEINKLHEDLETEMSKTWFQKLLGR